MSIWGFAVFIGYLLQNNQGDQGDPLYHYKLAQKAGHHRTLEQWIEKFREDLPGKEFKMIQKQEQPYSPYSPIGKLIIKFRNPSDLEEAYSKLPTWILVTRPWLHPILGHYTYIVSPCAPGTVWNLRETEGPW